jgi:hypothetical protein
MRKAALAIVFFFSFCLLPAPILAKNPPQPTSPNNGSLVGENPKLTWRWDGSCVENGSCFLIQVASSEDFSNIIKNTYTSNLFYSPQELSKGTWFWRVKAKDQSQTWSSWSQTWSFTLDLNKPSQSPADPHQKAETSEQLCEGNPSLNEFLPFPAQGEEWVEIFNNSSQSCDLSGWEVDDIDGGSSPYTIENGKIVSPFAYLVIYFSNKLNNSSDSVRLLKPDGTEVEKYTYEKAEKGFSFAKDSSGNWFVSSNPSPGFTNPREVASAPKDSKPKVNKPVTEIKTNNENLVPTLGIATTATKTNSKSNSTLSAGLKNNQRNYYLLAFGVILVVTSLIYLFLKNSLGVYLKKLKKNFG